MALLNGTAEHSRGSCQLSRHGSCAFGPGQEPADRGARDTLHLPLASQVGLELEGTFVDVQGHRVHAVTRGTGPDLVLIHGASGNLRDMTFRFMDLLAVRYRVTAFDRPGLGYTDAAPHRGLFNASGESPMEQAQLLRAAAHELGIERPIVLGHSFRGAVALALALGDPEVTAAVVDVSGVAMPWPGRLGWLYRANGPWLGSAIVPPLVAAFAPGPLVSQAVEATFAPNPVL